jgi:class 3 adenylate cyclase
MGFGLHAGWAIEGAVGSLQKVDATYLSPHVNMAARLETSSKQYGVPLLASQVTFCAPAVYVIGLVRSETVFVTTAVAKSLQNSTHFCNFSA